MRDIEASIGRYLVAMDTADRQEPTIAKVKTERLPPCGDIDRQPLIWRKMFAMNLT